jgi:hypothetical protein
MNIHRVAAAKGLSNSNGRQAVKEPLKWNKFNLLVWMTHMEWVEVRRNLLRPYTASVLVSPSFTIRYFPLSLISMTKVAIFPALVNIYIWE